MIDNSLMRTEDAWLAERRTGVTATDAPVVLGLTGSRYRLWAEKCGLLESEDLSDREWIEWGHRLQPVIGEAYRERTGREVTPWPIYTLARSERVPWMLCTPDFEQRDPAFGPGALETKTTGQFLAGEWRDGPPLIYQVQLQHQLAVLGAEWGTLCCLIGGQKLVWFDQLLNGRFVEAMVEAEAEFWGRVQRGDPPPVDGTEATREALHRLHPEDTGETVALPPQAERWDRTIARARKAEGKLKTLRTEAENQLKAALGIASYGLLPGGGRWKWCVEPRKAYEVEESKPRVLRRLNK
jgi:putative phage-type endonuclease